MKKLLLIVLLATACLFFGATKSQAQSLVHPPLYQSFTGFYGSATLDFPSASPYDFADLTIYVKNARVGDPVILGTPPSAVPNKRFIFYAWVSSADYVTVRFTNLEYADAVNPAPGVFKVRVFVDRYNETGIDDGSQY